MPHARSGAVVVVPPGTSLPRGRLERGRRRAEAIAAWVAESDAYAAILPGPERHLARLYLPFLLETTGLYVVEPEQAAGACVMMAAAPVLAERRFGPLRVRKVTLFGRPSAAIDPDG